MCKILKTQQGVFGKFLVNLPTSLARLVIFGLVAQIFSAGVSGILIQEPKDYWHFTINQTNPILLKCSTNETFDGKAVIVWSFIRTNGPRVDLYTRSDDLTKGKENTYDVQYDNSTEGSWNVNLKIKKVKSLDVAGQYICTNGDGAPPVNANQFACAEVVVFEREPECNAKVIKGSEARVCCSIKYLGNISPSMTIWNKTGSTRDQVIKRNFLKFIEKESNNYCLAFNWTAQEQYDCEITLSDEIVSCGGVRKPRKWNGPQYIYNWPLTWNSGGSVFHNGMNFTWLEIFFIITGIYIHKESVQAQA